MTPFKDNPCSGGAMHFFEGVEKLLEIWFTENDDKEADLRHIPSYRERFNVAATKEGQAEQMFPNTNHNTQLPNMTALEKSLKHETFEALIISNHR